MAKRRKEELPDPVRDRLAESSPMARLAAAASAPPSAAKPSAPKAPPDPLEEELQVEVNPAQPREQSVAQRAAQPVPRRYPSSAEARGGPRKRAQPSNAPERATESKKVRFTKTEAEGNEDVVRLIRRLTGTKTSEACVTRVLWSLLRGAEQELKDAARGGLELYRPPNGTSLEMAAYEEDLAHFLHSALRAFEK